MDAAADAPASAAPDPVGMKLAGQSDQLSDVDADMLNERGPLGVRFGTMVTRVIEDYRDQRVTADVWIASTRTRLQRADRALSGLRQRTDSISDAPVRRQLERFDDARAATLVALNRLLRNVRDGDVDAEGRTQRLVDRRIAAYQRTSRHLYDLMEPYLSDETKELLERAGGA
jgi:hypothetical protein